MKKQLSPNVTPLVEDPSQPSYIRELLEAGRSARVSGYDVEQGLGTHLSRIASGAPMPEWAEGLRPVPAPAAGTAAGGGLLTWVLAPVVAIVVGATAALVYRGQPDANAGPTRVAAPSAATDHPVLAGARDTNAAAVPQVQPSSGKTTAPSAARESVATTIPVSGDSTSKFVKPSRAPAPKAKLAAQLSSGRTSSLIARGAAPEHALEPKPAVTPASQSVGRSAPAQAEPSRPVSASTQPVAAPSENAPARPEATAAAPAPAKAQLDDARLEREMGMLAMTERVLKSDPERALRLAHQGEAEFPGSMFTQERQQLLLLALVELGRIDEAKRLAKPYLTRFAKGPFSDRVRRALAAGHLDP